jgi:hypothetical protein
MKFSKEIESFIKDYVSDLRENNAAIFAGAGMSKAVGYVDWPGLLSDIADELGLKIDKEYDLISLAQYHVNENRGTAKITRKILEEFSEKAEPSENHKILARLPISTFWTTNYDTLIEDTLKDFNKITDTKHEVEQLAVTRPKRDAIVYKMHGDVHHPTKAVITKEHYQSYYKTHEYFITALQGDLLTKTFLFIGFSFTDPNLDYVLSRLSIAFGVNTKEHYCFIKKVVKGEKDDDEIFKYNIRKQELMINDLKRYHIKALLIDDHPIITQVLSEIETRYKKKTIFVSGSAEQYGEWGRDKAQGLIHSLSKDLLINGFNIVNGFGWGIGSAVINGALEAVYQKPEKVSYDQLIIRPFPQFKTGKKDLPELWEEYRQNMISLAGIAIIAFGNKSKDNEIVTADGVVRELEIAVEKGVIPIPLPTTGYAAKKIYDMIVADPEKYYHADHKTLLPFIEQLNDVNLSGAEIITQVLKNNSNN